MTDEIDERIQKIAEHLRSLGKDNEVFLTYDGREWDAFACALPNVFITEYAEFSVFGEDSAIKALDSLASKIS